MMLKTVWEYILRIFGIAKSNTTGEQLTENMEFTQKYEAAEEINFTAIFANKLSSLAMSESTADVAGNNGRGAFLDQCLEEVWGRMKRVVSRMLGAELRQWMNPNETTDEAQKILEEIAERQNFGALPIKEDLGSLPQTL